MRIESIKLKNYRQFKNVEILLPKKGNHDLFVLIGQNGAGKTNILNAINWCFYGDEPHLSRDSKQIPILNTETIREASGGRNQEVIVEVGVNADDGRGNIIFKRQSDFMIYESDKIPYLQNSLFEAIYSDEKHNTKIVKEEEANSIVERFVSKEMRDFFFFDGERLDNYFKIATTQNISHAVFVISQIDLLHNKIEKKIESILRDLRREIGKENPEIDKISAEIETCEDELKNTEVQIEECKKEIEISKDELKEIGNKLQGIPDTESLESERRRLIQDRKHKTELYEAKKIEKQDLLFDSQKAIMLRQVIAEALAIINEKKRNKEIPPTIDKHLLEEIIRSKTCIICGTQLDNEKETKVKSLLESISISSIVSQTLLNMENPLLLYKDKISEFSDKLKEITHEIDNYYKSLENIEQQINIIDKKLSGYNATKIVKLQEQRKSFEDSLEYNQKLLGQLEMKKKESEEQLSGLKEQYETEMDKEKRFQLIKKQIRFCSKAFELVKNIEETILNETRERIEKETNEIFFELIWKKKTFRKINIEPDFNINIIHSDGYDCLGSLSSAEREVLALSFTLALQSISGYAAPILIDTPVARVSDELRTNFAKVLTNVSINQQTILLFTPSEYSKEISELLDRENSVKFILKLSASEKETKVEVLNA